MTPWLSWFCYLRFVVRFVRLFVRGIYMVLYTALYQQSNTIRISSDLLLDCSAFSRDVSWTCLIWLIALWVIYPVVCRDLSWRS
jgi:hypothetical protein